MTKWSAHWVRNSAVLVSGPTLATCWLPPSSWGFYSYYVLFELFVSKYLSGVPVN